ncbi:MAG TPA: Snf7 family protein [Candidatus Dormibacteraeota bacterium]|jgi:division protein CdvB (Snf7/Vps24/ESCRT-III family)|nr:Snf7 family protein [Candidatus Dormibacteraeota bacterium]
MFRDNLSFADKIREAIKPTPVKRRIQIAAYKLRNQTNRLEKSISQMESRDRHLHEKCVKALEARDTQTATLFANECVQIRKLIKTSLSSQICLEQALLRLETIEQFGDMVHSMGGIRGILTTVRGELEGKLPEISTGINDVEDSLENLTMEIGEAVDSEGTYVLPSDESAKILKEADLMAEQKMREKFPEIPQIPVDAHRVR